MSLPFDYGPDACQLVTFAGAVARDTDNPTIITALVETGADPAAQLGRTSIRRLERQARPKSSGRRAVGHHK